jgi:DNA-binding GntR family transcriptional regulator
MRAQPRRTSARAPRRAKKASARGASLSEHAYSEIREQILRGELALGATLSRRRLAAELVMSVLPVAEALKRLENDGFVKSRARVGTRVCRPTPEDVREQYEVREALECQSARLFAEKASGQERRELEEMARQLDELFNRCAAGESDPQFLYNVRSYHAQFHLRMAECTGCRALREILEKNHVLMFTWLFDMAARRPVLPPRHHRDLVRAINRGTPEEADRAMRLHTREGLAAIMRALAEKSWRADPVREGVSVGARSAGRGSAPTHRYGKH